MNPLRTVWRGTSNIFDKHVKGRFAVSNVFIFLTLDPCRKTWPIFAIINVKGVCKIRHPICRGTAGHSFINRYPSWRVTLTIFHNFQRYDIIYHKYPIIRHLIWIWIPHWGTFAKSRIQFIAVYMYHYVLKKT